jgi:hypothetical protein|nr:MAG TPA: hypothetical protein [Caudoviricetes sp.]
MDNTIEKLTDVIDNLIELNEKNYSEDNSAYNNADFYGAGHTKRINEQKRKEKRRARRSMKQEFELEYLGEWLHW